jgi:hypothetical protein
MYKDVMSLPGSSFTMALARLLHSIPHVIYSTCTAKRNKEKRKKAIAHRKPPSLNIITIVDSGHIASNIQTEAPYTGNKPYSTLAKRINSC